MKKCAHHADAFDSENHSGEENWQLFNARKHFDAAYRLQVYEYEVQCQRQARHYADVGEDGERHEVLEIPDLSEQHDSRNERYDVVSDANVHPGVEVRYLHVEKTKCFIDIKNGDFSKNTQQWQIFPGCRIAKQ